MAVRNAREPNPFKVSSDEEIASLLTPEKGKIKPGRESAIDRLTDSPFDGARGFSLPVLGTAARRRSGLFIYRAAD